VLGQEPFIRKIAARARQIKGVDFGGFAETQTASPPTYSVIALD
jgi:hypothetical protein